MILRRFSNDESVSTRLPIQSHDIDYMALVHRFNEAEVDAIALLGSHRARTPVYIAMSISCGL